MQLYVRSESVVSRVIGGETLIVPIRKGVGDLASIYSLNEVGSAIWEAIARPATKEQVVGRLASEFEAGQETIEQDVEGFLAEMQSAGLVRSAGIFAA